MATTSKLVELFNAFADASLVDSTATAFVEAAYENLLGLSGDFSNKDARVAYWVAQIEGGVSRADFANTFLTAAAVQGDLLTDAEFAANGVALTAIAALDETDLTLDAVKAAVTVTEEEEEESNPGETFTLTTSNDVVEGTDGDDTITAAKGTLNSADVISDAYATDTDTLNAVIAADNLAPTVSGVEAINVSLDVFDGADATLDASNISGATITLSSSKLGFNGTAEADNTGTNTIVAGDSVTTLTVGAGGAMTAGTVDAGAATTVAVTGTAGSANTIIANGSMALTNNTSTVSTLKTTADATITYDTTANIATTVTGSGDVVLKMAAADITAAHSMVNSKESGSLTLQMTDTGAVATNFAVDTVVVGDATTTSATVASGQAVRTNADMTSLTLATAATSATTVSIETGYDLTTLDVSDNSLDTAITVTDEVIISTLTATGEDVTLAGDSKVIVTTADATSFDASALTADLVYTSTVSASISGGSANNTVTLADADAGYVGQGGVDTVSIAALANNVGLELGAGNDVVKLSTGLTGSLTVDGGEGTDTIALLATGNISGLTLDATAIEGFSLVDDATFAANQLSGETLTISGTVASDRGETVTVTGTATGSSETIDLSGITIAASVGEDNGTGGTATVFINGQDAKKDTITGTAAADQIDGGTGADVLTGGEGKDIFVFAASDSTETSLAKITDYTAGSDKLDLANATVASDVTATDVSGVGAISAIFTNATSTVNYVVTDGILTLTGLAADLALADTLAEWVDIAEAAGDQTIAFEFGGNTYVIDGATNAATSMVELTGVTGITAVSATAAADTIQIA